MAKKEKYGFIKSIFKFSIATWINFIIGVLSTVILTRVFTPEVYGILNVFNVTSGTIMSLICFGLDSSYIRYYNEPPDGNSRVNLAFKLISVSLLFSIVTGTITSVFFYQQFSVAVFGQISWFLSVMLFVSAISALLLRFLNITYRMSFNARQYTIQSIMVQISTKLLVVGAAFLNPTANVVITFNVGGIFILAIIYAFFQRKDIVPAKIEINYKGYGEVFRYAFFEAPINIAVHLNAFFAQLIIRQTIDMAAVGIYASAYAFVAILQVLRGGFGTYWSAFMYNNYKTNKEEILEVHDYVLMLLLFAFLFIVMFKDIVYIMIGYAYHGSKEFFALMLIYPLLNIAAETTMYGLSIQKKNYITLINYVISISSNLIICILMTRIWGLKGAALASCISGVVLFALNTYWGQKYYISVKNIKKTVLWVVLILGIAFSVTLISNYIILYSVLLLLAFLASALYRQEVKIVLAAVIDIIKLITQKYQK